MGELTSPLAARDEWRRPLVYWSTTCREFEPILEKLDLSGSPSANACELQRGKNCSIEVVTAIGQSGRAPASAQDGRACQTGSFAKLAGAR
jgi:hypothetical protein